MKISKEKSKDVETALKAWAKKNKATLRSDNNFWLAKGNWKIEVIVENGWAYVHGHGALNGLSTNIETVAEFDAAVKRLTAIK